MNTEERITFIPFKKHNVFVKNWAIPDPKAHLLIVHGLGEHTGSYHGMAHALNQAGVNCYGFDLLGHGKTTGQRGYVPSLNEFVSQTEVIVDHILENFLKDSKNPKLHIFSHSMGGLIHLKKLQAQAFKSQASAIFSNPLLGLNMKVPEWKVQVAKNLAHVLPRLALFNEIKNEDLSHDPSMFESYTNDSLRHSKISARLYIEILEQTQLLQSQKMQFDVPTLVLLSPSDKICNADKTQDFFAGKPSAQVELFPQSAHEIINDLTKQRAFDIISNFILGEKP